MVIAVLPRYGLIGGTTWTALHGKAVHVRERSDGRHFADLYRDPFATRNGKPPISIYAIKANGERTYYAHASLDNIVQAVLEVAHAKTTPQGVSLEEEMQ